MGFAASSSLSVLVLVRIPPSLDLPFCLGGGIWTCSAVGALLVCSCEMCIVLLPELYRGSSGVEPCFLIECRDLSLELARLLACCFSLVSVRLCSEEFNLWDDLDAIRLEKKDFDGSRTWCVAFGEEGEGGMSGIAVM